MTNKEKFLSLVTTDDSNTIKKVKERQLNRERLRESQQIALKVLLKLDEIGWSQKSSQKKCWYHPSKSVKL